MSLLEAAVAAGGGARDHELLAALEASDVEWRKARDSIFEGPASMLAFEEGFPLQWARQKLALLVERVESHCPWRQPDASLMVLLCVEAFAQGHGRWWLKVAGGSKAHLLEACVPSSAFNNVHARRQPCVEFGAFVAYSTLRLARCICRHHASGPSSPQGLLVASLEVDMTHVVIARSLLHFGTRSNVAEVFVGQVRDVLPRLSEEVGASTVPFEFADHNGTAVHVDLRSSCSLSVCSPMTTQVVDNTLSPGAPLLAWFANCCFQKVSQDSAVFWSLPEFGRGGNEDWVAALHVG
eukprot:gnl/MRDRNA2_/MRDRNA2_254449_c0_seq1.p1 gnl/MRDRNA2_/MRDRNA2_254449_c0~~gnl/MRDRNA2_/MRDRNA2_254449_c0_seq1.p1  ORF type:complete len:295 (-),score=45.08 gnl/MRDRNA2_/MRDRNA2_254449_c0_seq1:150-1034(-)